MGPVSRSLRSLVRDDTEFADSVFKQPAAFPRLDFARVLQSQCPSLEQRAQGKPGANCTRSLVCRRDEQTSLSHYRFSQTSRLSPRDGLTVSFMLSPGEAAFLAPVAGGTYHQCSARVAAPGPHDFAVRCRRFAGCKHLTPAAAIATRTTFRDDRETSLTVAWAGAECSSDLRNSQAARCGFYEIYFAAPPRGRIAETLQGFS
jgi:hypothetical protein